MYNVSGHRVFNLPQSQYLLVSAESHNLATTAGKQGDSEKKPFKPRWHFLFSIGPTYVWIFYVMLVEIDLWMLELFFYVIKLQI